MLEHCDRRLSRDNEPSEQRRQRDKQIPQPPLGHSSAECRTERGKADVYAREKQNEPDVCIRYTEQHRKESPTAHAKNEQLKYQKDSDYRQHSDRRLPDVNGQRRDKAPTYFNGAAVACRYKFECALAVTNEKSEQHNGDYRTYRAKRDKSEAVRFRAVVTSHI